MLGNVRYSKSTFKAKLVDILRLFAFIWLFFTLLNMVYFLEEPYLVRRVPFWWESILSAVDLPSAGILTEALATLNGLISLRVLSNFLPVLAGWVLAYLVTTSAIKLLYKLDDWQAARLQLSRFRKGPKNSKPIMVDNSLPLTSDGRPQLPIIGSAYISVSACAAVTEQNGRFYRVLGPGFHALRRFEQLRTIVDLRPQVRKASALELRSADGVTLTTEVTLVFSINRANAQPTREQPFPFDPDAVRTAAYYATWRLGRAGIMNWSTVALSIAIETVRDSIAAVRLAQLVQSESDVQMQRRTQTEIERRARAFLQGFGIEVHTLSLGRFVLPEAVENQQVKSWQSRRKAHQRLEMARTEEPRRQRANLARMEAQLKTLMETAMSVQRNSVEEPDNELVSVVVRLRDLLDRVVAEQHRLTP